jgi:saccharopine dehydrogenase (NAD+, L-lysine-forming)
VTATLTGPNPYSLTADSVLRIMPRIRRLPTGFQTPSRALGADFAASLDGVTVTMDALR